MSGLNELDIISIGDTTTDVFLDIEDADLHCNIKKEECLFCVKYAGKVPVKSVVEIDAVGNAANNVVGSARLGLKSAIWTTLGMDVNGMQAQEVFESENVKTDLIVKDKDRGTNFSAVLNFNAERTILVYHEHRKYVFPFLPKSKWIYLTSMANNWEKVTKPLLSHIKKTNTKLAFNPGTYQIKSGLKKLKPFIKMTDLLIVNLEEAQKILNETKPVEFLLKEFVKLGVKNIVITNGSEGADCYDGKHHYHMPIYPDSRPAVERTGCGDSFSTALIAALNYGKSLDEGLKWGAANARSVIQYIGAREGLLSVEKIEQTIREFPHIFPVKREI